MPDAGDHQVYDRLRYACGARLTRHSQFAGNFEDEDDLSPYCQPCSIAFVSAQQEYPVRGRRISKSQGAASPAGLTGRLPRRVVCKVAMTGMTRARVVSATGVASLDVWLN